MVSDLSPFAGQYEDFSAGRKRATGYDFGKAPIGNVSPPAVRFATPLCWWSLDRPRRIAQHLAWRDRFQGEILALGTEQPGVSVRARGGFRSSADYPCVAGPARAGRGIMADPDGATRRRAA